MSISVLIISDIAWSAAMDFFLAIFPWFVLWGLNMKKKEKITICCSLSLGVLYVLLSTHHYPVLG